MTGAEASELGCICLESEELIVAISETIIDAHGLVSRGGRCFDPLSGADGSAKDATLGKLTSIVNSSFGILYGTHPDERFGGDLFLQVSTFCEHLAKDHVFPDGNKRTALVMSLAMLSIKGVAVEVRDPLDPFDNPVYRWIQDVVSGERVVAELAASLMEWARPRAR